MALENIEAGKQVPDDVNVIIEIPAHSSPIKYELDKSSGLVMVDRFISTAMFYPCDYGFIPHTLAEDGDPLDALVISPYPLLSGVLIRCRPVGLLRMTDDSGGDAKILCVPIDKLTTRYQQVQKPEDLGVDFLATIEHFFKHYKDLEKGKWTQMNGWEDGAAAREEILASVKRYQQENK